MSFVYESIQATEITSSTITTRAGCNYASTVNVNIATTGVGSVIDGATLIGGDRVLLKNQTDQRQNGIYFVGGTFDRADDFAINSRVGGTMVFIFAGATQADTGWVCTSNPPSDLVGPNNIVFQQISGTGVDGNVSTSATQTLTNKTLVQPVIETISVNGPILTLPAVTDELVVKASTQTLTSKILSTDCVWNGNAVPVAHGGTGVTSFSNGILSYQGGFTSVPSPTSNICGVDDSQTLANKLLANGTCRIGNATQAMRVSFNGPAMDVTLSFESSGNHIFIFPPVGDFMVTRSSTDILTNKTLTLPTIASINNSGTITLPTGTRTLVARDTVDTLTNKTLTLPIISSISNAGTLTLPTGNQTLVGRDTVDTLTNKTLTLPIITSINNSGTVTLPTGNQTLVARITTDTLTNKTIIGSTNNVEARSLATNNAGAVDVSGAPPPLAGQVLTATSATAATWQTPTGGATFGSNFAFVGPVSFSTTNSTATLVTGSTLSATLPAGTYIIEWTYKWRYTQTTTNFTGTFLVDGASIGDAFHIEEPNDGAASQRRTGYTRHFQVFTAGSHNASMQIGSGTAGQTSAVVGLYVSWYRVA